MKLSDYKGEDALDLLADILEPMSSIIADNKLKEAFRSNTPKLLLVKMVLKDHKKEVLEIMAMTEGVDPADYKPNVLSLPVKIMDLLNDEEFMELFQLQGQNTEEENSGSATEENTPEKEK